MRSWARSTALWTERSAVWFWPGSITAFRRDGSRGEIRVKVMQKSGLGAGRIRVLGSAEIGSWVGQDSGLWGGKTRGLWLRVLHEG